MHRVKGYAAWRDFLLVKDQGLMRLGHGRLRGRVPFDLFQLLHEILRDKLKSLAVGLAGLRVTYSSNDL